MIFILNGLDSNGYGADLVIHVMQQVGRNITHSGKGLSDPALLLRGAQSLLTRVVLNCQHSVMCQTGKHLLIPAGFGKTSKVSIRAENTERANCMAIIPGQKR